MLFLLLALPLDLLFNAANSLLYYDNNVQLMLILLQDTLQVLAILGLAIRFSSTFVFQAGLIGHLLRRFSCSIIVAFLYLALSIIYHFFSLKENWLSKENTKDKEYFGWKTPKTFLFLLQRTVAIFYYFFYKKTVLMLSDPKYHSESEWLLRKIGKRIVIN
uniref:Transmembrane protein 138 n=1 Tax=Meloidogyne enterolobii TaxID=390850 RepID=A0A6V7Y7H5_MELEN|nr:unnamed protein product [Meloidogyne enterolobii]